MGNDGSAELRILMVPPAVLGGTVVDAATRRGLDAVVTVLIEEVGSLVSSSADTREGAFEISDLPSGPAVVMAAAEGFAPTWRTLTLETDEQQQIQIGLLLEAAVSGTVVNASGQPISTAWVGVGYEDDDGAFGLGAAVYLNEGHQSLIGVPVPPDYDPYTAANPPPGWILPPETLTVLGASGLHLPRTTYRFGNRGGTRNMGVELWLDQGLSTSSRIRLAYSWQARPRIRDDERPYPIEQLSLPPAHRLSAVGTFDGSRFLGSASLTTATRAFWADVLTPDYHGFSDAYASVDAAFGVKWRAGAVTTSIKVTNLLNRTMQQHVFGDLLRRTVFAEVKLKL